MDSEYFGTWQLAKITGLTITSGSIEEYEKLVENGYRLQFDSSGRFFVSIPFSIQEGGFIPIFGCTVTDTLDGRYEIIKADGRDTIFGTADDLYQEICPKKYEYWRKNPNFYRR